MNVINYCKLAYFVFHKLVLVLHWWGHFCGDKILWVLYTISIKFLQWCGLFYQKTISVKVTETNFMLKLPVLQLISYFMHFCRLYRFSVWKVDQPLWPWPLLLWWLCVRRSYTKLCLLQWLHWQKVRNLKWTFKKQIMHRNSLWLPWEMEMALCQDNWSILFYITTNIVHYWTRGVNSFSRSGQVLNAVF